MVLGDCDVQRIDLVSVLAEDIDPRLSQPLHDDSMPINTCNPERIYTALILHLDIHILILEYQLYHLFWTLSRRTHNRVDFAFINSPVEVQVGCASSSQVYKETVVQCLDGPKNVLLKLRKLVPFFLGVLVRFFSNKRGLKHWFFWVRFGVWLWSQCQVKLGSERARPLDFATLLKFFSRTNETCQTLIWANYCVWGIWDWFFDARRFFGSYALF